MITPENITRKQAQRLVQLLERETRCEIMARFAPFNNLEFAEYARKQMTFKNKIRKFLFGTSDLVELGDTWGMLTSGPRRPHVKRKLKKKKKRRL